MLYRTVLPNNLGPGMFAEGLQGLIDVTGREVLPPVHVHVGHFHEGLAAVGVAYARFGFVDVQGHWAIEPRYSTVGKFADGRGPVGIFEGETQRWAFIDEKGIEVFPFEEPTFIEARASRSRRRR
jgi:hypothetical protein